MEHPVLFKFIGFISFLFLLQNNQDGTCKKLWVCIMTFFSGKKNLCDDSFNNNINYIKSELNLE